MTAWRHADEAYSDRVCAAVVVGSLTFPNLCGCARAVPVAAIESVGPACATCGHRIEPTAALVNVTSSFKRWQPGGNITVAADDIRERSRAHRLPSGAHLDVPCADRQVCGDRWLLLRAIDQIVLQVGPSCYCHECGTASDIPPSTVSG